MISKSYDVFISYSSHDKLATEKIAQWLRCKNLRVWYDDWEILVGHDIVDKVYEGIRNSRFLLVLLSERSVKSKWVQQECNAAKIREIESGATVVLPAIIETTAKPLIPEALKTERYADVAADFESALAEIEYAVSVIKSTQTAPVGVVTSTVLALKTKLIKTAVADINANGWKQHEAFRQVVILPNGPMPQIRKQDLEQVVDSCTVEIAGYGGPSFPYRRIYSQVKELHHADGFAIVDNHAWPDEDWSFYYWYFTQSGLFLQRTHLFEDHMENTPRKTLALEWLNLSVAQLLLFAQKLQSVVEGYPEVGIQFLLHGMKDRQLVILDRRRSGSFRDYASSDDDIEVEAIVGQETDLVATGLDMVLDIIWRFGWGQPSEKILRENMATLCSGRFPK